VVHLVMPRYSPSPPRTKLKSKTKGKKKKTYKISGLVEC
jgi:hypothetical protein